MSPHSATDLLSKYWGHTHFRPLQADIIANVTDGIDTIALLPTGGGKSICFQVPGLMMDGICLVISPLIALMNDQVAQLTAKGIKAAAITSGMHFRECENILANAAEGGIKFLYLSPERIDSDKFKNKLSYLKVGLIAIDEAHCISQWGFDFRPSYLNIYALRTIFPKIPFIALTATATEQVISDISTHLQLENFKLFRKSFERKNITYAVIETENKLERLVKVFDKIKGSGIVYVRNRKLTWSIAQLLNRNQIPAIHYHAGLTHDERNNSQKLWMDGKVRVVVATNAFGMGIDKSNVRLVLHLEMPDNPEAYYQEAGRAGRDEQQAYAVLLYNKSDEEEALQRLEQKYPAPSFIKKVYQALFNYLQVPIGSGCNAIYPFNLIDFCNNYNLDSFSTLYAIKILEHHHYISFNEDAETKSKLLITIPHQELYHYQVSNKHDAGVINVLLRSYEGLFMNYQILIENDIAKRLNVSTQLVIDALKRLHKQNICDYIQASNMPSILLLKDRMPLEHFYLDHTFLTERKNLHVKKLKAMLQYVQSHYICRTNILLAYFNEIKTTNCENCDYCRRRKKLNLNDEDIAKIKLNIINVLKEKEQTLSNVISKTSLAKPEKVVAVIDWMIETNKIIKSNGDLLSLSLNEG